MNDKKHEATETTTVDGDWYVGIDLGGTGACLRGVNTTGYVIDVTGSGQQGALGDGPGISITVGIGVVVVQGPRLRVIDGIGPAVGDSGAGAWIGEEGLRAAARSDFPMRDTGGPTPASFHLLAVALRELGSPTTWEQKLSVADRPCLLAGFARHVVDAAQQGNLALRFIIDQAATRLLATLSAALGDHPDPGPVVAASGGLMSEDSLLRAVFAGKLARSRGTVVVSAKGSPIDGAVELARRIDGGEPPKADSDWLTVKEHRP